MNEIEALLTAVGARQNLLQALRHLGSRPAALSLEIGPSLQGLQGYPDWEIQATAFLKAAQLGIAELAPAIAHITFPEDPTLGVSRHENRILLALRDAALAMLGQPRDKPLPDGLIEAIRGEQSDLPADVGAFVHSLVTPLPADIPPPVPARGVEITGQGPQTTDGSLLIWVPPMAYWLGHYAQLRGEPNPARRVELSTGFYVEAEAREPASFSDALAMAEAHANEIGHPVRLPTSDEWEMAARGPDGRRYPWGQNADPALRVDLSPLGMADIISGPGEWLASPKTADRVLTTEGTRSWLLSARSAANVEEQRAYRLVYPI
ncbi:MAG: formylglycine-generating enzyme family protein [Hyphomicrobium sp.]